MIEADGASEWLRDLPATGACALALGLGLRLGIGLGLGLGLGLGERVLRMTAEYAIRRVQSATPSRPSRPSPCSRGGAWRTKPGRGPEGRTLGEA